MTENPPQFLIRGGEMGARMRSYDWAASPLGPPHGWPQSLRTIVRMMLDSRFAMWMAWGPEYTFFCNDAYAPTVGIKRDWALGARADQVWAEIWPDIGPLIDDVRATGEATWNEGLLLFLERSGYTEETFHTFSYSPVYGDDNRIAGMLCVVTETTDLMIGQRRLTLLHDLAALSSGGADSVAVAGARFVDALSGGQRDVAFAALYLAEAGGARLVASNDRALEHAAPALIDLDDLDSPWGVARVLSEGREQLIEHFERRCAIVGGAWAEPVQQALVLPLMGAGERPLGALLLGVSTRRALDGGYRNFLALIAGQVAAALADTQGRLEERRRAEALAELDRAKSAFFSNVSHEFRTPLTLMLGPIEELLARPGLPAGERETLELLRRNGQRMRKLVNSLLDFSRIEAGRMQANYRAVDLGALTADLASAFRAAVEGAGLTLTVRCEPLPEAVYVDRDMWEKVVLNLLSNAFKFTFEGGIAVHLAARGTMVEMRVVDTGVGIPEEELPRLFDRFHRVPGARSRSQEGTGIGLALVRELARLHGGTVEVQSRAGEGTTFTVTIPLGSAHLPAGSVNNNARTGVADGGAVVDAGAFIDDALRAGAGVVAATLTGAAEGAAEGAAAAGSGELQGGLPGELPGELRRARILVADDNADMRSYLQRLLEPFWEVEVVGDGMQALERIAAAAPDLLLTDVMMPRLDGFGLLQRLRGQEKTRGLPVIVLSAQAGEEARIEGLNRGADDYLVKPFSGRELVARVEMQLMRARINSAQEALDRRLADVFRDAPVAVSLLAGPRHVLQFVNSNFQALLPQQAMVGRPIIEVFPGLREQGMLDALDRVRASGEPHFGRAFPSPVTDPVSGAVRMRYWDFVYQPLRGADGQIDGIATVGSDVTELVLARQRAESANRAKDEFIAMLGHELRNPLAPIVTTLELMRLRGGDAFLRERGIIERQVGHMSRLVDDLLDVARITRGSIELKPVVVELESIVDKAVETARPLLERRGQSLRLNVAWRGLELYADPLRATQIISNLLTNAAKFGGQNGVVEIAARREGGNVLLTVRDDGIGMTAGEIARVFDLFVQGGDDQEMHRPQGGLGLGLAIARSLAALHGGSLDAASPGRGQGSVFSLRLPLHAGAAAPVEQPHARHARVNGAGKRVLVVDDNVDAALTMEELLRAWGFETVVAHDGLAAVELLKSVPLDIALVDIGLPKLDGYGVAQRVTSDGPAKAVRLIALTGYGQEADRQRSRESGFHAHLVKPVDLEKLAEMLR
ncbi:MAG: Chemotaxis protein methyltransferase CheR [Betaproteobacteria bacterium]|nr:Chemotaxis protein methyltransferase CheR [Betaproteobacteria bacterium]